MIKLNKSSVVFEPVGHTYHLGEKELQGVTGILHRRLFANKYAGVSQEVLNKAAQRGSFIHGMCDLVDSLGVVPDEKCVEAANYIKLKESKKLVCVASEYLVSDNEHYATSIDAVYEGTIGVILNDRKTTSKLDMEYLSWQLSINAYLFELQNPDVPVDGLSATWLRGDICEYVDVERKPVEDVKALLKADINDEPFEYYPINEIPDFIIERLDTMGYLNTRIKALQTELDQLKAEVEEQMVATETKSVSTPIASFSYTPPTTSTSFDSKKFQAENPELAEKYQKESKKKGYLTIKFK